MRKPKNRAFIVKVQQPVFTSDPDAGYFIYNVDRSFQQMFPPSGAVSKLVGRKLKSFWYARFVPDPAMPSARQLMLDKPAPWQNW